MLKVLYAGSPEAAAKTLELLLKDASTSNFEICGVLTNAPSVQGRHKTPVPTPVESLARENSIPVFAPEHLDKEAREAVQKLNPDILVCFAYGHIFGPKFMSLFRFGGINLHPSRLPEFRGCTPVNAAILNRKEKTAFTIQKVSEKMDEGNILRQEEVCLNGKETAFSLLNDAAIWGAKAFSELLSEISSTDSIAEGKVQTGEASYTGMIKKEDAKILWKKDSFEIDAMVRAYFSNPCAWTENEEGYIKILEGFPLEEKEGLELLQNCGAVSGSEMENGVAEKVPGKVLAFIKGKGIIVDCAQGYYSITRLQKQGKNEMGYKDFMNGARNFIGSLLK